MTTDRALFQKAQTSVKNAYAPYTRIKVGVAVLLENGTVYTGSNFENAAYMHGLDAFEGAIGQLHVSGAWAKDNRQPKITRIVHCFEKKPDRPGLYLPGPVSLMFLKLWAANNAEFIFITQEGKEFARHTACELLAGLPPPAIDLNEFSAFSHNRYNKEASHNPFKETDLKRLYEVRLNAFDPVSHYAVAAMIKTTTGEIFFGCNCEPGHNKALHAEGTALAAMVNRLGPEAVLQSVTILTGGRPGFPCGGCRQHIHEFATDDTEIIAMNIKGERLVSRHADLLPKRFGKTDLEIYSTRG